MVLIIILTQRVKNRKLNHFWFFCFGCKLFKYYKRMFLITLVNCDLLLYLKSFEPFFLIRVIKYYSATSLGVSEFTLIYCPLHVVKTV